MGKEGPDVKKLLSTAHPRSDFLRVIANHSEPFLLTKWQSMSAILLSGQ